MKSSFNILFIFTLICLSFIVAAQSRQGHHKHKKVGGWNEVPLESPHVYEKGLQFLLNEKKQLIEGYSLERVEAQVVAGFNYRFTFKNKQGTIAQSVVFQDIHNKLQIKYFTIGDIEL